ncbi:MAG: hypothetical protein JWM68_4925 [Verrucomicrobiales bacterium]|nr:hypothetical protein [Verrucomicrobiales bacterium]
MRYLHKILRHIEANNLHDTKKLLKEKPYLFHFEQDGWPILHRCIAKRCVDLEVVELFILAGGDVNRKTESGTSLAFLAASNSDHRGIRDLLVLNGGEMSTFEKGVIIMMTNLNDRQTKAIISNMLRRDPLLASQCGANGFTLLHHATANFRFSIVRLLLKSGANPKAITCAGRSTLGLLGCPLTNEEIACRKLLIAYGAEYTALEQLIEMIRKGKDDEVANWLQGAPRMMNSLIPPFGPLLHVSVLLANSDELTKYLLQHGVDPNVPNERGETTLHQVLRRAPSQLLLSLIRVLVANGANPNKPDERGYTPLHEAASSSWDEPVKLLVKLGARVDVKTKEGETPIDIVKKTRFLGYRSLLHWLKSRPRRGLER